ncbi:ribonuclease inhibitor [Protobothrops mucrosquamatus]|uniref:ribonuclease inhibitor n=1 Tax=Protobothrops mucrosquamatus TaxID=103944 RepID=UPI0010FB5C54|nr:ribonuclease inhibitor [Protobothrops mucrosquamatus]
MRHLAEVFRENQRLRQLSLSLKNPDDRAMEVLCEGLKHPECTIERLQLDGEFTNESYMRYLTEVLRKNQGLRELFLSLKNPDDKGIKVLCEGLKHPECTIERLQLGGEIGNQSYIRNLAEVFRKNHRLRQLYLNLDNPDDRGMEVLCKGLKHPECSIDMLLLAGEIANESYMRHLTEVFRKNQRLRQLCLFLKNPDDKAIKVLCEGLKHPQCTIEALVLGGENTNESYMRHLTEVFKENQRLRQLCLSPKNPDDRAMEVLCEGLKHPECTIERLQLAGENINESYMRHLTEVFKENQRLRQLCLSLKNPDDRTMEVLFEGLKHPQCTIEKLQLGGENTNESYMRHLTEIFRKNQRLREIFLSLNNADDRVIKILCEGLKHPQCAIERLELGGEIANKSYTRHLAEVFRENHRLRRLCLSPKNPDDRAMEVLCEGLKHPECTIEMLQLDGEFANESYMRYLTEVLRKNQGLRELYLSLKNPDDKAMEVLCEGLKHPECTIERLQLGGEIGNQSYMRNLAEVFRENHRLRQLYLNLNNPDDRGMEVLCKGLKHPECSINMLLLAGEIANESYMRHLTEVFRKNQRLRELCLFLKNPDDKAIEVLCEGLKHPQCTIERLELGGENTNESYMRYLTEVFRSNQRLRELFLSFNNTDDRIIKILCEGLKHPQCTIERLDLGGEITNENYTRHLAEVFRENQRLGQLSLCLKNPDDRAMEVLCEGLKHPECTIERLQLDGEFANESYMRYLREVLRKNQRLRELFLSLKNPDDKAMEVLCEGLKHPECTIDRLHLGGEIGNQSYMRNLAEVFRENYRLRQLYLNLDNPDCRGMEVLCKGLKHPECSIDMLLLAGEIANESYMRHLTEIFWKNQRLRKLCLFLKNPDDKAIKVLCEGLKHPQCTIEILVLGGENTNESYMRYLTEVFRSNQRLRELCLSLNNADDRVIKILCEGLKHPQCTIERLQLNGQTWKWKIK